MGIEGVVKAPTASVSEMDGFVVPALPPEQCPAQEESEDDSNASSKKTLASSKETLACTVACHEPFGIGDQESATCD